MCVEEIQGYTSDPSSNREHLRISLQTTFTAIDASYHGIDHVISHLEPDAGIRQTVMGRKAHFTQV